MCTYCVLYIHAEKIHVSESFFLFHSHLFKTTNVQTFFVCGPGAAWIKAHPLPLVIISLEGVQSNIEGKLLDNLVATPELTVGLYLKWLGHEISCCCNIYDLAQILQTRQKEKLLYIFIFED